MNVARDLPITALTKDGPSILVFVLLRRINMINLREREMVRMREYMLSEWPLNSRGTLHATTSGRSDFFTRR